MLVSPGPPPPHPPITTDTFHPLVLIYPLSARAVITPLKMIVNLFVIALSLIPNTAEGFLHIEQSMEGDLVLQTTEAGRVLMNGVDIFAQLSELAMQKHTLENALEDLRREIDTVRDFLMLLAKIITGGDAFRVRYVFTSHVSIPSSIDLISIAPGLSRKQARRQPRQLRLRHLQLHFLPLQRGLHLPSMLSVGGIL